MENLRNLVVALLILAAVAVGALALFGNEGERLVGRPAPDFTGTTLAGETVRLSQFRGRPVLLNFYSTW